MAEYTLEITSAMVNAAQQLASQAMQAKSYIEFKDIILQLNATVRGYKTDEFDNFRNHDEQVTYQNNIIWIAPSVSVIDTLLEGAWKKSFEFNIPSQRAGYLYHAIYTIHPFKNGNGRTGRSLFYCCTSSKDDFKDRVWCNSWIDCLRICNEIGSTHELLQKSLRADLISITHLSTANSLVLTDCKFEDPWYWRFCPWSMGMTDKYKNLLKECYDKSLRFPHVALLKIALDLGHVNHETFAMQNSEKIIIDIHPEAFMSMNTNGTCVLEDIQKYKIQFVKNFLQDKTALIKNALTQDKLLPQNAVIFSQKLDHP